MISPIWTVGTYPSFLHSFVDRNSKGIIPLVYALQWNTHFESLHMHDMGKLSNDVFTGVCAVTLRNSSLKELAITGNTVVSKDFFGILVESIAANANSKLTALDFSGLAVDDKAASVLASIVYRMPTGLSVLRMSDCNLTKKGITTILSSLKKTPLKSADTNGSASSLNMAHTSKFSMPLVDTLTNLDMSQNAMPSEGILALSEFLAMPNHLKKLTLSHCSITNTEVIFGALVRGCLQDLQILELDGNKFTTTENISPSFVSSYQAVLC